MDLAAAIAGLISLTDLIFKKGSDFYSRATNATTEIEGLLREVKNLKGALSSLENHVNQFQDICNGIKFSLSSNYISPHVTNIHSYNHIEINVKPNSSLVYIEECQRCLQELSSALEKLVPTNSGGARAKRKGRKLKISLEWPFSVSRTTELANKI